MTSPCATDGERNLTRDEVEDALHAAEMYAIPSWRGYKDGMWNVKADFAAALCKLALVGLNARVSETGTPTTLREDLEEIIGSVKNALSRTETEGNAQLNRGTLGRIQMIAEAALRDFSTPSATPMPDFDSLAGPDFNQEANLHADTIAERHDARADDKNGEALVHSICERFRMANDEESCEKCPARVEVPNHGEGTPGCYLLAEETVRLVREATASATRFSVREQIELVVEAGYDRDKVHPACYAGFSYSELFEAIAKRLTQREYVHSSELKRD